MNELISPKYQMKLIEDVEQALWAEFPTSKYKNIEYYIQKWQQWADRSGDIFYEEWSPNFTITKKQDGNIDVKSTLHTISECDGGITLLKMAIELGVDTPDFIPSIPTFKNAIKSDYITAYDTFVKAYKQIESDPSLAIGLANSALESIIKEILKNDQINSNIKSTDTLYALTIGILKIFQLFPNTDMPIEIKTIGSSLLAINQNIEKLRSEKTTVHGKTIEDYIVQDPLYAYFIVNSIATVGLFLNSYYKKKFPKDEVQKNTIFEDDLPF
ncbi:MAG: abortive infection family protein [Syntrophomonadaceae bacterium]|jgi:hypothetical protein|nr:abortive infection family protein [Syntrophomonadaceae bacterium]